MTILGFTGTREAPTSNQLSWLDFYLRMLELPATLHHGRCVAHVVERIFECLNGGADAARFMEQGPMSRTSIDYTGYSTEGVIIGAGVARRDAITVELDYPDAIKMRPGRRVVVLTEDEFRQLTEEGAYCPKCDDE